MLSLNRLSSLPLPVERGGGRASVSTSLIFLALFLLGAVIRLTGLSIQSFGFDELWGIRQAAMPLGEMMTHLAEQDVQPPAYALLQWVWTRLFPVTETWLRLLPALLGILSIPLAYGVARRLFGSAVALTATALIAVHPFLAEYAQEARNYSLLQAAGLLSLLLLLRWADKPESLPRMAFYILAAALLPYAHAYGALLFLAQGVWVMLSMPRLRNSYWIAAFITVLLFIPWLLNFALQIKGALSTQSFLDGAGLVRPTFSLLMNWLGAWGGYEPVTSALLFALAAWGVLTAEGRARSLLFCLLLIPIFLPLMVSLVSGPIIHVKCGIAIISVLCIAAAAGLQQLPPPLAALLLFALMAVKAGWLLETRQAPRHEQYRELAALARQDHALGAEVLAESHLQKTLGFYLGKEDFVQWLTPEQSGQKLGAPLSGGSGLVTYLSVTREDYGSAAKFAALPALVHQEIPLHRARALRLRLDPGETMPVNAVVPAPYAEGQAFAPVSPTPPDLEAGVPPLLPETFEEGPASPPETPGIVTLPPPLAPVVTTPAPAPGPARLVAPRVTGKTPAAVKAGKAGKAN